MQKTKNTQKTPPTDWHNADIKAALEKAGWSLRRLSVERGYSPNCVGAALKQGWPKGERIIADVLGVTPQTIWPSRYEQDGTPIGRRPVKDMTLHKTRFFTRKCNSFMEQFKVEVSQEN